MEFTLYSPRALMTLLVVSVRADKEIFPLMQER